MSPYMQNVVDRQKDAAVKDFQRMQQGRDAQAIRQSGGLESGRKFLQDMLAEEDLQDQLGDIQAQGQQQAFEQAASMFGQDRSAMMEQESKRYNELAARKRRKPKSMPAQATKPPPKEPEYRRRAVRRLC